MARPVAWRGSEMMAISAQHTKKRVAIATWEWGSYFDPKLKIEGIKLNISNWRGLHQIQSLGYESFRTLYDLYSIKHEAKKTVIPTFTNVDHEEKYEATDNVFFKDKNGELHTPVLDS